MFASELWKRHKLRERGLRPRSKQEVGQHRPVGLVCGSPSLSTYHRAVAGNRGATSFSVCYKAVCKWAVALLDFLSKRFKGSLLLHPEFDRLVSPSFGRIFVVVTLFYGVASVLRKWVLSSAKLDGSTG